MSKKYNEVMEKIQVTDEMRARILSSIEKEAVMPAPARITHITSFKKYLSVAACLAAVLVCVLIAPTLLNRPQNDPYVQTTPNIGSYQSAEELSAAVGFTVEELPSLPFSATTTTYSSYEGQLAEISYSSSSAQNAAYRKSIGTTDNSGCYGPFSVVKQLPIDSKNISLSGNGNGYSLAWWTDGEYVCSVCLSFELAEKDWQELLAGV